MRVVGQGGLRRPRVGVGVAVFGTGTAFAWALFDETAAVARRIEVGKLFGDSRVFEGFKYYSGLAERIWLAFIVEEYGRDKGGV
jgi:hypothetical protein